MDRSAQGSRPGFANLGGHRGEIKIAVCSSASRATVDLIVSSFLTEEISFAQIFTPEDLASREQRSGKAAVYRLALKSMQLDRSRCLAIEDSDKGLLAARQAGVACIVTIPKHKPVDSYHQANLVVDELGDPPGNHLRLSDLESVLSAKGSMISSNEKAQKSEWKKKYTKRFARTIGYLRVGDTPHLSVASW